MTGSSKHPQGQLTFADKIFGINPYSKDDPNHDAWESNARFAAEEEAIFDAELLKRNPVTPAEYARYVQDGMLGHFDILARRFLVFKFRSAESIAIYEEGLTQMTESMLTRADQRCPASIPKAPFLFELHRQFRQRIAHWTAEALKRMREGLTGVEQGPSKAAKAGRSRPAERGKYCCTVIEDAKKIKNLCLGTGRSVAEIQKEHPDLAIWKVRESLSEDDRDVFNHPNRWGAPVGYAKSILAKTSDVSVHTIESWVKARRKTQRSKNHADRR